MLLLLLQKSDATLFVLSFSTRNFVLSFIWTVLEELKVGVVQLAVLTEIS
jgi:hypothetical protein